MKITSLKFKLTFFTILLLVFVAASFSYYLRRGQRKAIVNNQEMSRVETVKALRQVAREAILVDDDTGIVNYLNLLKRSITISYAMVLYEDGRVRAHTDPLLIGQVLNDAPTKLALSQKSPQTPFFQPLTVEGREILDLSIPIIIGADPAEYKGIARIGFDKAEIDKQISYSIREQDQRMIEAFIYGLILGIAGALLLSTFITKPIETLRHGAQQIGEGKLNHRIHVNTRDELKVLADEFNLMAEKLAELDRMKQDFVSNVTHELRSPMTSIRGYIDLLLQGAGGPLSDLQKDYLSVVKNSSVRLGRFIDNLLDVAKIEAHKLKLTPEPLDIRQLVHEMEVLFKPQLGEKGIAFKNELPQNGLMAFADKDKLAEVLINLTSNAIKFTPEKGHIRARAVEAANSIELVIEDTGVGIPSDMIGKLFNKFEQVKANEGHARKHKGTGLGLTIAKGIVEAHGGKIWITSPASWGKGTAFHFTIPKVTEQLKTQLRDRIKFT